MPDPASTAPGPADAGLPVERTALAWRRTGLSLTAAGALAARLLAHVWNAPAYGLGAIVIAVGLAMLAVPRPRLVLAERAVRSGIARSPGPEAGLIAVTSATTALLGVVFLVALLRTV